MPKLKIKKGDTVMVTTGKDKNKTGVVLKVNPTEALLTVQGINLVTKHMRQSYGNDGGRVQKEAPIHYSNVMILDPIKKIATKVGFRMEEGGKKVRFAKASGELLAGKN